MSREHNPRPKVWWSCFGFVCLLPRMHPLRGERVVGFWSEAQSTPYGVEVVISDLLVATDNAPLLGARVIWHWFGKCKIVTTP